LEERARQFVSSGWAEHFTWVDEST
jgi:hypothetical protein